MPATLLYLLRHGATEANLAHPPRLQGRCQDPPLAPVGVQQAEAIRDQLAGRNLHHCFTSPLLRAVQTAQIVCAPHGLTPEPLEALTECDVGRWGGLTWDEIRQREPETLAQFLAQPSTCPYPEGESLQEVYRRVAPTLDGLLTRFSGQNVLVVTHQVVCRAYVAPLCGLTLDQARQITLANGGCFTITRQGTNTTVLAEDSLSANHAL